MKNPQAIMNGMAEKNRQLSMKVDELKPLAEDRAQAEMDYNVAYAQKLFKLKANGEAVTTAKTLAKGDKAVADLLFKFRVADAIYKACEKKIYSLNTAIDTYRSLLSWEKAEMGKAGIG